MENSVVYTKLSTWSINTLNFYVNTTNDFTINYSVAPDAILLIDIATGIFLFFSEI